MAFQVKEFDSIQKGSAIDWKFKLINKANSQFNFYDLDENVRSLLDLANEISSQMDLQIQSKNKNDRPKNRFIRKATEKLIKVLKISLTSFAHDIGEQLDAVKAFFKKQKLPQTKFSMIIEKSKKWASSVWLSLEKDQYFRATQKYIQSYVKDSKKIHQDFQHLTELYGILIGQQNTPFADEPQTQHESLIQIDVNLNIDNKYISECLLYDAEKLSYIKTRNFSQHFVNDLLKQNSIEGIDKEKIKELEEEVRIQIRSQCLYKTLLKRHASVLLNFSTIEIPSDMKEYLIPIEIKLKSKEGQIAYEDYFQWDLLNENNNIEKFCEQIIEDIGLDPKYFSQLCYSIRSQINLELQWKFMLLVKTYKQIHKDRESPKLNTQTTAIIRKNLPYSMDVLMVPENKIYKPQDNMVFANSDVFSLLSRNIDILPEEYQSFLLDKQGKDKNEEGFDKTQATSSAKQTSRFKNLTSIYDKKGIKLEANPYLNGINLNQSNSIWKKLMDEKTTIQ